MLKLTIREDQTYTIIDIPRTDRVIDAEELINIMRADILKVGNDREHMVAVFMDRGYAHVMHGVVFSGDVDGAGIHPSVIARHALLAGADLVAIGHNHPSGSCRPSKKDVEGTVEIQKFLESVGVTLTNSFVIGSQGFSDCVKILDDVDLHKAELIRNADTKPGTERET